jgi:hypothetical protein
MPEALTNDVYNRAKLILNASGVSGGVNWSATVTDGNPTYGGYGYSGAYLSITVGGNVVENVGNQSYDFGGSTGSNTIVANAFFPRTGRSFSNFIGLPPGDHLVSGTFYTTGNVGTATVSFYVNVPSPPPPPPPPGPVFSDNTVASTARIGVAYSDGVAASNSPSYSVVSGALPGGLTLNTSTGAITGTPTTPGIFTFVVRASNAGGSADTSTLTITVFSGARVWNGTAFVSGLANVWNGTAFVSGIIKVWDGTNWVNTN